MIFTGEGWVEGSEGEGWRRVRERGEGWIEESKGGGVRVRGRGE